MNELKKDNFSDGYRPVNPEASEDFSHLTDLFDFEETDTKKKEVPKIERIVELK